MYKTYGKFLWGILIFYFFVSHNIDWVHTKRFTRLWKSFTRMVVMIVRKFLYHIQKEITCDSFYV